MGDAATSPGFGSSGRFGIKKSALILEGRRIHKETGGPLEATVVRHETLDQPGMHVRVSALPEAAAFSPSGRRPASAPAPGSSPDSYLSKRSGFGGSAASLHKVLLCTSPLRPMTSPYPGHLTMTIPSLSDIGVDIGAAAAAVRRTRPATAAASTSSGSSGAGARPGLFTLLGSPLRGPPVAGAKFPRHNPPNTEFRRFYERGDLPCAVDPKSTRRCLMWRTAVERVDLLHYLPVFMDGLREQEYPFSFVALQGVRELLAVAPSTAVLPVVPALIHPLRNALSTRLPAVMLAAIEAMTRAVLADARPGATQCVGRALVPYYRQLLPVLAIFAGRNCNLGDRTEYSQRKGENLGDRIEELFCLLETYGGPDAFANLKYMIPTYQSCVRGVVPVVHK